MKRISAVIITRNEEKNIARCVRSLKFADEVLVADTGSTDRTVEIASALGCSTFEIPWEGGFGPVKKKAVGKAGNEWILSVDADEAVSPELARKISDLPEDSDRSGYNIKRRSFYLGREIKFSGWGSDYPLRLFNRKKGNFNDLPVHEFAECEGPVERIYEPLMHYTYPDLKTHVEKMIRYAEISAGILSKEKKRYSAPGSFMRAVLKFKKMYFLKAGFLDGREGFILALVSAFGIFYKYSSVKPAETETD
ncbi:MAG: glycosyltransferase family 2 protein [Fibrobacterota bacterium]